MSYQSKTISLHEDVWAALNRLRTAQGENGKPASYNKILSKWLADSNGKRRETGKAREKDRK